MKKEIHFYEKKNQISTIGKRTEIKSILKYWIHNMKQHTQTIFLTPLQNTQYFEFIMCNLNKKCIKWNLKIFLDISQNQCLPTEWHPSVDSVPRNPSPDSLSHSLLLTLSWTLLPSPADFHYSGAGHRSQNLWRAAYQWNGTLPWILFPGSLLQTHLVPAAGPCPQAQQTSATQEQGPLARTSISHTSLKRNKSH